MTTFSGRDPEALSDEEKNALFGDLYDISLEEIEEAGEDEEASAPDATAAEVPVDLHPEDIEAVAELPEADDEEAPESGEEPSSDEVIEPALDETPAEVVAAEEPVAEEETWKQRYADLRATEMQALADARSRAEAAEAQLAELLQKRAEPRISPEVLQELAREAGEAGLEPEQLAILAKINEAANPQDDTMVNYLSRQAEEARTAAAQTLAAQEAATLASFAQDHEDLDPETMMESARFMYDIGAAEFFDQYGNAIPEEYAYEEKLAAVNNGQIVFQSWPPNEPLDRAMLELAYEAAKNPDLAFILRGNPEYARSEHGLAYAREQASQRAAQRGVTTLPAPAKSKEEIEASLAAAETLGGTSGAEPRVPEEQFLPRKEVHFSK